MSKKNLFIVIALIAMITMFVSCNWAEKEVENQLFQSYQDYSILVKNDSTTNVVCFVGSPTPGNFIGGVRASSTNGLKNDKAIFTRTGDFVLFCVSEADYLKYSALKDYNSLKERPFARLYAYYNEDAANRANIVYRISSHLGGQYTITLNNSTAYNVEFRKDGLYGEPLCFCAGNTLKTTIYVDEGNYDIFPVFRRFDKTTSEILTTYPKTAKGNPQYINFSLDSVTKTYEIDVEDFYDSETFTIALSCAYLTIQNNIKTSVGVALYKGNGTTATQTTAGGIYIIAGKSSNYEVEMNKIGSSSDGYVYSSTFEISDGTWRVGPTQQKYDIPAKTFEAGKMYTLIVEGSTWDDLYVRWSDEVITIDAGLKEQDFILK